METLMKKLRVLGVSVVPFLSCERLRRFLAKVSLYPGGQVMARPPSI